MPIVLSATTNSGIKFTPVPQTAPPASDESGPGPAPVFLSATARLVHPRTDMQNMWSAGP